MNPINTFKAGMVRNPKPSEVMVGGENLIDYCVNRGLDLAVIYLKFLYHKNPKQIPDFSDAAFSRAGGSMLMYEGRKVRSVVISAITGITYGTLENRMFKPSFSNEVILPREEHRDLDGLIYHEGTLIDSDPVRVANQKVKTNLLSNRAFGVNPGPKEVLVEHEGKLISLVEASDIYQRNLATLYLKFVSKKRVLKNINSFNNSLAPLIEVNYNGYKTSLAVVSAVTGIPYITLYSRYRLCKVGRELFDSNLIEKPDLDRLVLYRGKLLDPRYDRIC